MYVFPRTILFSLDPGAQLNSCCIYRLAVLVLYVSATHRICWPAGWLAGRRLVGWLAGWLAGWLGGWLAGGLVGWVGGRLGGRLASLLAGRPAILSSSLHASR